VYIFRYFVRAILALFILPKNYLLYRYSRTELDQSRAVKSLKTNGFYKFPERLNEEELKKIQLDYTCQMQRTCVESVGQNSGRIYNPHLNAPFLREYANRLQSIVDEYFGVTNVPLEMSLYQKSLVPNSIMDVPGGYGYHTDDNKKNIKIFIYLSDVNIDNGPFCVSPKSHGFVASKLKSWVFWEITSNRKYLYSDTLPNKCDPHVEIIGKSGTIFIVDTTAYHKAIPLVRGSRDLFLLSFSERRFDPYKIIMPLKERLIGK